MAGQSGRTGAVEVEGKSRNAERSETITSVRNVPERNEKGRQYRQYFLNLEDLHAGLEIKSKYADWFKNMSTYGFTENETNHDGF